MNLELDNSSGIATVTLDNPEKHNAMSGAMMVDLAKIVHELEQWKEGKGVVLRGNNDAFCSGADLQLVKGIMNNGDGRDMCTLMQDTLSRLYTLPLVSVALVHGVALGGGAELTTSCDYRIVTNDATIGFVQMKMGVMTGWGGGTRLVQLIGRTAALDLLTTGKVLSWREALSIGLANGMVQATDGAALDRANEWLDHRTFGEPAVVQAAKKIVVAASSDIYRSLAAEKDAFCDVWGGPAHVNAMQKKPKHK